MDIKRPTHCVGENAASGVFFVLGKCLLGKGMVGRLVFAALSHPTVYSTYTPMHPRHTALRPHTNGDDPPWKHAHQGPATGAVGCGGQGKSIEQNA